MESPVIVIWLVVRIALNRCYTAITRRYKIRLDYIVNVLTLSFGFLSQLAAVRIQQRRIDTVHYPSFVSCIHFRHHTTHRSETDYRDEPRRQNESATNNIIVFLFFFKGERMIWTTKKKGKGFSFYLSMVRNVNCNASKIFPSQPAARCVMCGALITRLPLWNVVNLERGNQTNQKPRREKNEYYKRNEK